MNDASARAPSALAPSGILRVAINFGNPVLATRDDAGGPAGVSVAIAQELSRRAGVPVRFVTFDAAGKVFETAERNLWDVAFLASDPARAAQISFTAPYVRIEAAALVSKDSPFHSFADLDRPGVRITVGQGAAYELQLIRRIKHATLVRSPTSAGAIHLFENERLEAAAGIRIALDDHAARRTWLRVMDEPLAEIRQAMGVPIAQAAARAYLDDFLIALKADGFISAALERYGQSAAVVVCGP